MKRIRLTCNWTQDKSLVERFTSAYITPENFDPEYVFTHEDNFDYLVIINWPTKEINFPRNKTVGVIMEPSWSPLVSNSKYYLNQKCNHVIYHKKDGLDIDNLIYYPGTLPYHMDSKDTLQYFIETEFKKSRLCSIVVTNHGDYNPSPSCLYPGRVNLVKEILKTDLDIDIFGNSWVKSNFNNDERIKGEIINKKDGLLDYKFSIAIENCVESGYFTEKLTDCILTDTTPIYFGCPNIDNFFQGIYKFDLLNDPIEQIKDILKNKETINQKNNKKLLVSKYNLYVALVKYFKSTNP